MEVWSIILTHTLIYYVVLGSIFAFTIFLVAKIKDLDDKEETWYPILNTVTGFIYFIIRGAMIGLPVLMILVIERRKARKQQESIRMVKAS